ncbi:hypothetical protein WJ04_21965 [Burkholderia vietnamiensis]|uniref:hypothetical protein n=1 Tax=Burkholderia vietnamiensis TaxID=60552 RepID=UPI000754A171|nr:hypothetical protein [Burkholderia vietnamiensis]KVF03721.1 hypothetical protein WJ04_21965 [Burkholderia vietnamiensis]
MKSASESKSAARRLVACAAVALVAAAPAAWAQNSQRADHGTGAPILSPPDTSAQDGGSGMSNGNTAAPPPATRMNDARGKRSHARPHVRTKPGGPSAAGNGGSGGSAGMGGVGAGQAGTGAGAGAGRSSGATGSGGTGSAGSSGY